eukprot:g15303.t1
MRTIYVAGSSEIILQPDYVEWKIDMRDSDPDPVKSKAMNDERYKAVLELAEDLDIVQEDIVIGEVSIYKTTKKNKDGEYVFAGYVVKREMVLVQRELDDFDEMLARLAEFKVEFNISYGSTKLREAKRKAQLQAVETAREKAEALAGVLGQKPIDVRVDRDPAVEDYDFSWVYWFETHGQRYVREAVARQGEGLDLPWDTPASRRWRGQVITALTPLLDDEDAGVRAAAALALARIGDEALLDRVLPGEVGGASLLLDASDEVRLSAWVSLGLLQTQASRAALGAEPIEGAEAVDRVGQAVAIGLMSKLDRVHGRWLLGRLDDASESLEVKRWCVWAMARHDDGSADEALDAVLANLPSTFVISEVLGNRAFVQRRGGAKWLVDVLRYHPDVRDWPGYRSLTRLGSEGINGSTPRRLAMETRVAASLSIAELPVLNDLEEQRFLLWQLRRRMVPGNTAEAMDFNRGFDTLAYFMHCVGRQDDRDLLYDQLRGFTSLRPDDPGVVAGLEAGEQPTEKDLLVRQSGNEVRSYAALAAGLMIRRATEGTGLNEQRPVVAARAIEIERLKRRFGVRLMRAVADQREPVSYRAACALALGLAGVHWVSVARGCIGNPWFFQQARAIMRGDHEEARSSPTIHQQRDVLREHFEISAELHGENQAGRMMRKFGIKFSRHHPQGDKVKKQFISTKNLADWQLVLDQWYAEDGPGAPYESVIPDEAEYVECGEPIGAEK